MNKPPFPWRNGARSLIRSRSAESLRSSSPTRSYIDEDEQANNFDTIRALSCEEEQDQLTPLVNTKTKLPTFNRSHSLDSDPEYQLFLYGTSAPFAVLKDEITSEPQKQNSFITIFAIWNTIIGSSLLAMPWSVQRAGFLIAFLLMFSISSLAVYTAYRLLNVQLQFGKDDIGEVPYLCRKLLGSWTEMLSRVFSFAIIFGTNIVYWILMSNCLYHVINYLTDSLFDWNTPVVDDPLLNITVECRRSKLMNNNSPIAYTEERPSLFKKIWDLEGTVPVFLIFIVAPLLNFKSPTFFTKFNSFGVLSVLYLIIFVITKSVNWGINLNFSDETIYFTKIYDGTFAATSGMLPLSLFIHNIIITLMRSSRDQYHYGRDLSVAYLLVVLTYIIIGFTFYVCFPLPKVCIEDNMLNNFPSGDVMTVIARIFLLFQLLTVFPLLSYMLRVQVFSALNYPSYPSTLHVMILNFINVLACVIFAIYMPHIGTVIRFTGAICGFVYIFTLPNLLYLAAKKQKNSLTVLNVTIHTAIPVIGLINLIAQFFVPD